MVAGQIRKKEKIMREAAAALNCEPAALPTIIEKFQRETAEAKKEIARLKK